jgi:Pyruvate/2-oxoacid:ferredoxin oxidoreductase gamma subunit
VTGVASPEAVRKAISTSVPRGTERLNLSAFEKGLEYGKSMLAVELAPA